MVQVFFALASICLLPLALRALWHMRWPILYTAVFVVAGLWLLIETIPDSQAHRDLHAFYAAAADALMPIGAFGEPVYSASDCQGNRHKFRALNEAMALTDSRKCGG